MSSVSGRMKRLLVALLVGAVVFSAVYGFAASLSVGSSSLGAGTSAVAACQSGTLTASYAVTYDSSIPAYKVGVVTVSGLDTSPGHCATKSYKVTLTGPGDRTHHWRKQPAPRRARERPSARTSARAT